MDEGLSRAVQTIFKRLYDDGLIYRAERIINWCPRCLHRAVRHRGRAHRGRGRAGLASATATATTASIVVATTRAETMLGDTAVAVHPDDERYKHLVGTRGGAAADRPAHPDRRRRPRRPGVRHRRGQGDPGARPERLRDRPAARPAEPDDHGRARRRSPRPARSRGWTGSRPARPSSRRCASRAGSSPRSGRTCTRSGTARAATPSSSRGCRCSGSSSVDPLAKAAGDAVRDGRVDDRAGGAGAALLRLGRQHARLVHLAGSCGGATGSRSGTARTARCVCVGPDEEPPPARAGARTTTCSTPGSPPRCGRSPRWAGRTTPPTCARSTRPACWSPATTSCSSGSPG